MVERSQAWQEWLRQWGKDIVSFAIAMWKHWRWWVCQILGSAVGVLVRTWGVMIPAWVLWAVALSGIVMAAFRSHRDQRRVAESKEEEIGQLRTQLEKSNADHAAELTQIKADHVAELAKILREQVKLSIAFINPDAGVFHLSCPQLSWSAWAL